MTLPKELTTVTKLSKTLALLTFVLMPIIGFFLGIRYQQMTDLIQKQTEIMIANWKTYTNNNLGVSFKYPSDWSSPRETNLSVHFLKDPDIRAVVGGCPGYAFSISKYDHLENYSISKPTKPGIVDKEPVQVFEQTNQYGCYRKVIFVNKFPEENYTPRLIIRMTQKDTNPRVLDQILSTFKFTNDNTEGVVCAQDAKLCSDGSYVSRSGPNCEFTPCPK